KRISSEPGWLWRRCPCPGSRRTRPTLRCSALVSAGSLRNLIIPQLKTEVGTSGGLTRRSPGIPDISSLLPRGRSGRRGGGRCRVCRLRPRWPRGGRAGGRGLAQIEAAFGKQDAVLHFDAGDAGGEVQLAQVEDRVDAPLQ